MLMLNKKLGSKAIVAIFYQKCRTSLISELFLFFFFFLPIVGLIFLSLFLKVI